MFLCILLAQQTLQPPLPLTQADDSVYDDPPVLALSFEPDVLAQPSSLRAQAGSGGSAAGVSFRQVAWSGVFALVGGFSFCPVDGVEGAVAARRHGRVERSASQPRTPHARTRAKTENQWGRCAPGVHPVEHNKRQAHCKRITVFCAVS